jgi:hypothetical protein
MRLALLAFGNDANTYSQAAFCLLSFLKADPALEATVVTDRPQAFETFGSRVRPLVAQEALLDEWRKPFDFFWRVKINALKAVAAVTPGEDLLYVDSDTVLVSGLDRLRGHLAEGHTLMHMAERPLSRGTTSTEAQMWRVLGGRTFEGATITAETTMWNAGVIGLPAAKAVTTLDHALRLCDAMCGTKARRRLIEQLAFSMALDAEGPLHDARHEILHYWGNKPEWQVVIDEFWRRSRQEGRSVEEDIAAFDVNRYVKIPTFSKLSSLQRWMQRCGIHVTPSPRNVRRFPE